MFVDEMTIRAQAGHGGDGVVRWLHLKGKEFSGPAGGDGGHGGNVVLRCVRDVSILGKYRHRKVFKAGRAEHGGSSSMHGKNGEDCIIDIPRGSVVTRTETGEVYEFLTEGEMVTVLKGGRGGYGNEHFKRSTNGTPYESTPGTPGESGTFHIELRLVVDAGFIGLPNAGKSSLLNALTRAASKVAAYPFTTLSPHLGDFYGFILADIPGLIEGASEGKGLGHTFLRHISRARLLLHCVSLEEEDPYASYEAVRSELAAHDEALARKDEIVVLTKADTVSDERRAEIEQLFEGKREVLCVSVIDDALLKSFQDRLTEILRKRS